MKHWLCDFSDLKNPYVGTGDVDDQRPGHHNYMESAGSKEGLYSFSEIEEDFGVLTKRCHRSGASKMSANPFPSGEDWTLRSYPTWDWNFELPVLVQFWMFIDCDDYSFVGNRFSQHTTKGANPRQGEIITSHIRQDGTFDLGHVDMTYRDKQFKAPLKQWFLQSVYIGRSPLGPRPYARLIINRAAVAHGFGLDNWERPYLRHGHFGSYGLNNGAPDHSYPSRPFKIYNDRIQITDTIEENLIVSLIEKELDLVAGTKPLPEPEPEPTNRLSLSLKYNNSTWSTSLEIDADGNIKEVIIK